MIIRVSVVLRRLFEMTQLTFGQPEGKSSSESSDSDSRDNTTVSSLKRIFKEFSLWRSVTSCTDVIMNLSSDVFVRIAGIAGVVAKYSFLVVQ